MVLIFSERANQSDYVKREVTLAANARIPIIPFRIELTDPAEELAFFLCTPHWLDALTEPLDGYIHELRETITLLLPALQATPFPTSRQKHEQGDAETGYSAGVGEVVAVQDTRARVVLTTEPPGAAVCIDGVELGRMTPCEYVRELGGVAACEVEVALALANYLPHRARVVLRRGEVQPYAVTLKNTPRLGEIADNPGTAPGWSGCRREFAMGSRDTDKDAYLDEKPQRLVYLDGFWMYQCAVTVAQFSRFCRETGRLMPANPPWGWHDDHPMVNVSWEDATAYAGWAGGALPSEAEWEKAARGTDGRTYPWGTSWDAARCCHSVGVRSPGKTAPVGSYPSGASPYGCLDMAGNVWQWCADWYGADYYRSALTRNPTGPEQGKKRVVRGGSWSIDSARDLRACGRYSSEPASGWSLLGFRCVLHALEE